MHNLHRNFDADDVFIMMSDISSLCHYFAYESAFKFSFEINLLREMKRCGDIVRYEPCNRIVKRFCVRHFQKVTRPRPFYLPLNIVGKRQECCN